MNSGDTKKKKAGRWGLIVLITILVIFVVIQLFLSLFLDSYLENRLASAVSEQTNGMYELKMDEFDLNLWGKYLQADDIRLQPSDSVSTAPELKVERLTVKNIQLLSYLFNGTVEAEEIEILKPEGSLVQNSRDSLSFLNSSGSSSNSSQTPQIKVDHFLIEEAKLSYWNSEESKVRGEVNDFSLSITGIHADSATRSQPPYFRFDSVHVATGKIRYELESDLYTLEMSKFNFLTSETYAFIDSLKLTPKYPKYEFSQTVGHQLDRIDLNVEKLLLYNPDIEKLASGELKAEKFAIQRADLEVFHDKHMPPAPGTKKKVFPQVQFKNLNFPVTIDTISVEHSVISYAEHLPGVSKPGEVVFADINGTFYHVTNDSAAVAGGHEIELDVTSEIMSEALLSAHFTLPLHKNGAHSVRGTLESMQAAQLNPVLEPVGLVRANSGTIHSLQFLMDLGETEATGWVQLVYSDLKIEVLDEKNVDDGGNKRIQTFLVNALAVKANNNENPFRRGKVSFERLQDKSIFNYWWKSLSTGLKDNIGL